MLTSFQASRRRRMFSAKCGNVNTENKCIPSGIKKGHFMQDFEIDFYAKIVILGIPIKIGIV